MTTPGFEYQRKRLVRDLRTQGVSDERVLEAMYQQTRNLGIKYDCPIIATSQISNEGDGLLYPSKGMLKDSKTGKQGACDAMIMIGQANDQNMAGIRGISTPKNKLKLEGKPSCPQEEVQFKMDIARYEDSPEG